MKLALLGTGMIVTEVLPVLTTIEGIELEAILSTPRSLDKAEALAKQYGLSQATSDHEAILSNQKLIRFMWELPTIPTMTMLRKRFWLASMLSVRNPSPYIWKSLKS